jgi:quercetin dioxygenase-like cupin family protein
VTVERIAAGDATFAYVIRREALAVAETTFFTPPDAGLQVGLVVYPAGGEVPRHTHRPLERSSAGTPEALLVQEGRCEVDVYDDDRRLVASAELRAGDVVVLVGGGHGFRMHEDTRLLEVRSGPYGGPEEKDRF